MHKRAESFNELRNDALSTYDAFWHLRNVEGVIVSNDSISGRR
jgi:hypothetical protein